MLGNIMSGLGNAFMNNTTFGQITDFASTGLGLGDQLNFTNQVAADSIEGENNAHRNMLAQLKNSAANQVESLQVQGMLKAAVDGQSAINDSEQHGRDTFRSFAESIREA